MRGLDFLKIFEHDDDLMFVFNNSYPLKLKPLIQAYHVESISYNDLDLLQLNLIREISDMDFGESVDAQAASNTKKMMKANLDLIYDFIMSEWVSIKIENNTLVVSSD